MQLEISAQPRKRKFNIPAMFNRIRASISEFPKATLFELRERGHASPFEQLVACLLSIRTLDEVSLPAAERVFNKASTPETLLKIPPGKLDELISPCTFHRQKAQNLRAICQILVTENAGRTPCDFESLTALPGIGPKCANLILGIACDIPRVGVDIHVHRITNRWGYVSAATPEKSLVQIEEKLPKSRWTEINELLVPFGKHICLGAVPKCSVCPVLEYCRQVGVTRSQ